MQLRRSCGERQLCPGSCDAASRCEMQSCRLEVPFTADGRRAPGAALRGALQVGRSAEAPPIGTCSDQSFAAACGHLPVEVRCCNISTKAGGLAECEMASPADTLQKLMSFGKNPKAAHLHLPPMSYPSYSSKRLVCPNSINLEWGSPGAPSQAATGLSLRSGSAPKPICGLSDNTTGQREPQASTTATV